MDNDRVIRTLRLMEWEKAKGSLYSILQTYWDNDYDDYRDKLEEFIKYVEDNGLFE